MPSTPRESALPVRIAELLSNSRRQLLEWLIWSGIVALAITQTSNFDQELADYAFGANGWPLAICAAIFIGATLQLAFVLLRRWRRQFLPSTDAAESTETRDTPPDQSESGQSTKRPVLQLAAIFILPFVFLILTPRIGFYITAPIFILALLYVMEVRSLVAFALVTATAYGVALLIFTRFLYVALPVGRIQPFYDINNAIVVLVRTGL